MSLTVNMKWKQAAQIIALVLENGTPEGKQIVKEELMKMADVADFAVDLQDELKRVSSDNAADGGEL
jgi:hypothetical protein